MRYAARGNYRVGGTAAINEKIEGSLVGKRPANGARSPANSANFTIFEGTFATRHASRGGIGVSLSSIWCLALNSEHHAVLVRLLVAYRAVRKVGRREGRQDGRKNKVCAQKNGDWTSLIVHTDSF